MKKIAWQSFVFRLSISLSIGTLIILVSTAYSYLKERNNRLVSAQSNAQITAIKAADEIEKELESFPEIVNQITNDLSNGTISRHGQIVDRLESLTQKDEYLLEIGLAYIPSTFGKNTNHYAPHYGLRDGIRQYFDLSQIKGYNYTERPWYKDTLKNGEGWITPYYGKATQTLVTGYAKTFYRLNLFTQTPEPIGVVRANLSLASLGKLTAKTDLGATGYTFLISHQQNILYHPAQPVENPDTKIDQWLTQTYNLEDIAKIKKSLNIALNGKNSPLVTVTDKNTDQQLWIMFVPIPSTNWAMGTIFVKDQLLSKYEQKAVYKDGQAISSLEFKQLYLCIESLLFIFFSAIPIFGVHKGTITGLWALSTTASSLLSVGICSVWYFSVSRSETHLPVTKNAILLMSNSTVQNFLESRPQPLNPKDVPVYIPTGVFLQSLEFLDSNNVFVTGYIWQKYSNNIPPDISREIIIPEGKETTITESYSNKTKDYQLIGWYFESTLRQNFDYSKYPFDYKDVWIRIWAKDFYKNVILTPDFESYQAISPRSFPGLEKDFVLPGWSVKGTYYEYRLNSYNTDFGVSNYIGQDNFPELYFTILVQRDFLTVFISSLMTPVVVAGLLYLTQILLKVDEGNPMEIVAAGGSLVFILMLDQINLRQKIATTGVIYIEYFYFAIYFLILLVCINAMLIERDYHIKQLKWMRYENNLIARLLYWPTLLGVCFLVTLFVFY